MLLPVPFSEFFDMRKIGLYIHIPFCNGKCPYCDFFSVQSDSTAHNFYTSRIIDKLNSQSGFLADTVYIGGGTPSIIGTDNLCRILDSARENFGTAEEVTIEVNPESAYSLDFEKLKYHGLNRVSMGLQSANENELKFLGRKHSAKDVENIVKKIQLAGISNISLDLMLGISGQTADSLKRSIDFCSNLDVAHISAYILKIEENTPYFNLKNTLNLPDEDSVCDLYELAVSRLESQGYYQYEISNFSKKGMESRHNLKYWRCEEYLGIGAAAHSFIGGKRFFYGRSFNDFYNDITTDDGFGGDKEEYIALALRLKEGLILENFRERFSADIPSQMLEQAKKLVQAGFVEVTSTGISLTVKGFLCSNTIISNLLSSGFSWENLF